MFLLYLSPLIYLSFLPYGKPSGMGVLQIGCFAAVRNIIIYLALEDECSHSLR